MVPAVAQSWFRAYDNIQNFKSVKYRPLFAQGCAKLAKILRSTSLHPSYNGKRKLGFYVYTTTFRRWENLANYVS